MHPMIKYRGGKSKEISHFVGNMPDKYNRYIEPFFGGGALYFYLEPQNAIKYKVIFVLQTNERGISDCKEAIR